MGEKYGKQLLHILHNNKRMHEMGAWLFDDAVKHYLIYPVEYVLRITDTIRTLEHFVVDWVYTYFAEIFTSISHTKKTW